MTGSGPLIELRDIGLEVTSPVRTRILHPVTLEIRRGTVVAVIGPSGAGKTTLASIIGALQPPSEGSYRFDGREVLDRTRNQLARFRADHLGFVFQSSHLIEERSALDNVALGIVDPAVTRADGLARGLAALAHVGLDQIAGRRAADLSGGERHRVAIARALVKEPSLVIADEPTAALDQATGREILDLLGSVVDRGATVLIVSHDQRATDRADQVIRIVDGRFFGEGTTENTAEQR
ncbi:MAG: ABC transporter ATP-binding protein [Propionibacteriales bacterium]|nr:ABC transporter ATP-binding protein [Propionibacteriales bacterium]